MTPEQRQGATLMAGIVVLFVFSAGSTFLGATPGVLHLTTMLVVLAFLIGTIVALFAWLVRIADRSEAVALREAVGTEAILIPDWDPRTVELATIATNARAELAHVQKLHALQVEDAATTSGPTGSRLVPEPKVVKAPFRVPSSARSSTGDNSRP